ncbi:MAG: GntR family transcriptional regulator [Erysipelotrichia bacterium]|jgi:GntR family transcriptional regulator|nr:GntR family transcriptional regulator [Erysipelotrichia bacterium]
MDQFIGEKPIYVQIMDRIKKDIVAGKLKTNDQIASVRELALDYHVNPNTVQRALSECEKDGYLRSDRTSGRFVSADEAMILDLKEKLLHEWVSQLVTQCKDIGLAENHVCELIHQMYRKEGTE